MEILKNDPENTEFKAQIQEFDRAPAHETLNPSDFLRELSARADNRAVVFAPEHIGSSRISFHDRPEDLVHADSVPPTLPRPFSSKSEDVNDEPTKDFSADENEYVVPSAAARWTEPHIKSRSSSAANTAEHSSRASSRIPSAHPARVGSEFKPRIPSHSTMTPTALYHKTEDFFTEPENTIIAKSTRHVRPATRTSDATPVPTPQPGSASTARRSPVADRIASPPAPLHSPSAAGETGEENDTGLVAYFFSDYGNEADEDLISIDHSNFKVPVGNYVPTDEERSTNMLSPSQGSLLILQSAKIGRANELSSAVHLTSEENDQSARKEEIHREESDLTQKPRLPLPTASPSNRPFSPSSSSPSPPTLPPAATAEVDAEAETTTRQTLPIFTDDDVGDDNEENMRKLFDRSNSLSNDDEQQPAHMWKNDEHIFNSEEEQHETHRSPRSATSASQTHSRIHSAASERENAHHANVEDDRDDQISPRAESARPRSKPSSRQLSRTTATLSPEKKFDEDAISRESPKRTPFPPLTPPPMLPQPVVLSSTESRTQRVRPRRIGEIPPPASPGANSITAQSFNLYLGSPTSLTREAAMKGNQPHAFSAESEHFLRGKPETSYEMNQRLPSDYSHSLSNHSSQRSSTLNSPLPVALESPDGTNEPPKTSRTATPQKKESVASIEVPPDAHALFTTTDEADPENPSVVHSTLHFQLYPSQMQTYSPTPIASKEPEQPASPAPMDEDRAVPDDNEHRSPSPTKSEHQLPLSTPTPALSYPARLEDLMRPTPSPLRPTHDDHQSDEELNDQAPTSSPSPPLAPAPVLPIPPVQHTHSSKFTPTLHPQTPPPASPSPPLEHRTHQSRIDSPRVKRIHVSGHKDPTFITEPQRGGSSERSVSSTRSARQTERLRRDRGQLSSASLKKPTAHAHRPEESSVTASPPPPPRDRAESMSNDEELAYMTPSQQQSKLSLRVRRKEPKRKTTSFENLAAHNDVI